ncbi:MAG: HAD-IA family hydrolase [Phycisphaerales bacterium]|nr:HAD-IA family hydrolase [Phycisphaerales bacterium]
MSKSRVKLVCFDLGGVVVRICQTWREACERAGLTYRREVEAPSLLERWRVISIEHATGLYDDGSYFERIAAHTGGAYTTEEVRRVHDAWIIEQYPDIEQLIERLIALPGIETGCLSNTNAEHWNEGMNLDHDGCPVDGPVSYPAVRMLRHRGASHLLGAFKPDEAIYRKYEQMTGYRGKEILFFDDLQENVDAAREIGWRAERIDPDGDTASQIRKRLQALRILPSPADRLTSGTEA